MSEVRELDRAISFDRFARGWHCLGLASEFNDGKPHAVQAFGGKLVVWADSHGDIQVIDGYCRHMGGDLTQGEVKGDEIACPFHDWRWGGDGRCKGIPYAKRVPPRARTTRYEVVVRNQQVLIWHDAEGGPADHDALPPELEGIGTAQWSDWTWNRLEVPGAHCREIVDNVVDMAHFFYVHFAFPTHFRNVFEGDRASQWMESTGRPDKGGGGYGNEDSLLKSVATYFGPSYMVNWLTSIYQGFVTEMVLINCHVPTSDNSFVLQFGLAVKRNEGLDDKTAAYIARKLTETFTEGFMQDVRIWQNKAPVENPLLCEQDGPVYQLRRWYQQFYVNRDEIQPDMTDRFEFEIDTSRAVESWRQEVAENMARLRPQEESAEAAPEASSTV